jgi:hypothetical protein
MQDTSLNAPPDSAVPASTTPTSATPISAATRATSGTQSLSSFGERVDSWADLIDDKADQAPAVAGAFSANIEARDVPTATYECGPLKDRSTSSQRNYQFVHVSAGARAVIYIAAYGRDLYLSWDLFVRRLWNRAVFIVIAILAILVGLWAWSMSDFSGFLGGMIGTAVVLCLGVVGAGVVRARDPMWFFKRNPNFFEMQDNTELTFAVHHALVKSADSVGIRASMLRLKEQFHGGQRDRLV